MLTATISLCLLAALHVGGAFLEGEPWWERILSGVMAIPLLLSAAGVRAGRTWAWWLAVAILLISVAWLVVSVVTEQDRELQAFVLGAGLLVFGAILRLLAHPDVTGSAGPSRQLLRVVSGTGRALVVIGVIAVAFESPGLGIVIVAAILVRRSHRRPNSARIAGRSSRRQHEPGP